jgi:hypothetical protein
MESVLKEVEGTVIALSSVPTACGKNMFSDNGAIHRSVVLTVPHFVQQ